MPTDRRTFVKALGAACALPQLAAAPAQTLPRRQRTPNVVLMICDDLGYGDLGSYGSRLPTPHLDRMAAEGVRFTHCNAAHPLCSASRSAVLTGRYAQRTHTRPVYMPFSKSGMSLDETTLANMFHGAGYRTHCIGKWHLGDALPYLPTNRGFDTYLGVPYSVDMEPLPLLRGTTTEETETDRHLLTPKYAAEAVRLIDGAGGEPFFLYLAFSYPHDPPRASSRFTGRSGFGHQGDAIAEIDWAAGEVFAALKRNGLDQDTIVLFTSDHGPWFQGSPGALRGRKGTTFEGGFRVPLLARWPGQFPAGQQAHAWVSNLDFVPTLAKLCALPPPPKPLDGADIASVLTTPAGAEPARGPVLYFCTNGDAQDLHCVRDGRWKLRVAQTDGEIYINDRASGNTSEWLPHPELYDLERDPEESYDLSMDHPERVRQMIAQADELLRTFPAETAEAYSALRQRARARTHRRAQRFVRQPARRCPRGRGNRRIAEADQRMQQGCMVNLTVHA